MFEAVKRYYRKDKGRKMKLVSQKCVKLVRAGSMLRSEPVEERGSWVSLRSSSRKYKFGDSHPGSGHLISGGRGSKKLTQQAWIRSKILLQPISVTVRARETDGINFVYKS